MTHIWVRAEQRQNEERVGITPQGVAALMAQGFSVTVEQSHVRAIPIDGYRATGCAIAPENSWPEAPRDAIIFGLKELPEDGTPLPHRHILFGHAYKGQPSGKVLLKRFLAGGGALYDLEYLVDGSGRRVAAFGYWAGYAGAAVALKCWAAQARGGIAGPLATYTERDDLLADLARDMAGLGAPNALVIGAKGRVGTGSADLMETMGLRVTKWDMAETAHGGPFPEVLAHAIFLNCILARPGCPVFVPRTALTAPRALRVIGDIACDPTSDFSPIKVYGQTTDWADPALRVAHDPVLDVTAIDNLPSLLPVESSEDFASLLLPSLLTLNDLSAGVWGRAKALFEQHSASL
jgi:saccharopine dehydrogenase (NAD+, L-lysine-forming)